MILADLDNSPVSHQIASVSFTNLWGTCQISAPVDARFLTVESGQYGPQIFYTASAHTDPVMWEVICQTAFGDVPADARFVCAVMDDTGSNLVFVFVRRIR